MQEEGQGTAKKSETGLGHELLVHRQGESKKETWCICERGREQGSISQDPLASGVVYTVSIAGGKRHF